MLTARSKSTGQRVFAWDARGRAVLTDVARGLHYLHSFRICHFDISSSSVLLTRELTAKISDVGLAR